MPAAGSHDFVQAQLDAFAAIGATEEGGVSRPGFSRGEAEARERLKQLMDRQLNLAVRVDAALNTFGRLEGSRSDAPALLVGSHLDTVPNGGRFDGALGVVAALAVVRRLQAEGRTLEHPLEVVSFCAEEANRFGLSTFGSQAAVRGYDVANLRERTDDRGRRFPEVFASLGGDLAQLETAQLAPEEVAAFVEMHVEQGRRLEREGLSVGFVDAITGIYRDQLRITGEADHAGTTAMGERLDALAGAAAAVQHLEALARDREGTVATVGELHVSPNGSNVVPGRVVMTAEYRSPSEATIREMRREFHEFAREACRGRGLSLAVKPQSSQAPVPMDDRVIQALGDASDSIGVGHRIVTSMAGHDAAHMAGLAPAGMIFVPSRRGRSHSPEEYTAPEDIATAVDVMYEAVVRLDQVLQPQGG